MCWTILASLRLGFCEERAGAVTGFPPGSPEDKTVQALFESGNRLKESRIKYTYETCSPRRTESPGAKSLLEDVTADLGIVIVICEDDLSFLKNIGCRGDRIRYYIYSICGVRQRDIARKVTWISDCLQRIQTEPSMLYSELSQSHGHVEFLTHILRYYDFLDENLIFLREGFDSNKMRGMMPLSEAVDTALEGKWAYKSLWSSKLALDFDQTPIPGNAETYGMELCALYKRFTCEEECFSCPADGAHGQGADARCAFVAPGSCFITTGARVRSLSKQDYGWIREWMQSWQEGSQGALRQSTGERMWPLILGCPEDLHSNLTGGGCPQGMAFPDKGERQKPPDEFVDEGLVHFPPPTFRHNNRHHYPHDKSPKHKNTRDISFVFTCGSKLPPNVDGPKLFQALAANVLYFHPNAMITLLVRSDYISLFKTDVSSAWFVSRVKLLEIETMTEVGHFGVMHSDLDPKTEVKDWANVNWMRAFSFEMRQRYLQMLADGQLQRSDGEDEPAHVVFLSLNTVLLHDVWEVFEGERFSIALALQPLRRRPIDASVMFVHRDSIPEAATLVGDAIRSHLQHGGFHGSFDQIVAHRILGCLPESWFSDTTPRVVPCCNGRATEGATIKLLPSTEWNGVVMKGNHTSPEFMQPWLEAEWAASAASTEARLVRIMSPGSHVSISDEISKISRTIMESFDPTIRTYMVFKNANRTFTNDVEARLRAVGQSNDLEEKRRQEIVSRRSSGETHLWSRIQTSVQLGVISDIEQWAPLEDEIKDRILLEKNPEDLRIDWDDPMIGYMYEILNPPKPTPEDYVVKALRAKPMFPRDWHNREYMNKLQKLYAESYLPLQARPSQARRVVEWWGGTKDAFPTRQEASEIVEHKLSQIREVAGAEKVAGTEPETEQPGAAGREKAAPGTESDSMDPDILRIIEEDPQEHESVLQIVLSWPRKLMSFIFGHK